MKIVIQRTLRICRELHVSEMLALRFVFLCCYPFFVTSILILLNSSTTFTASRLLLAALYNLAFFLIVAYVLRLTGPRLSAWLQRALLVFLALFTFGSVTHFLLFAQLLGLPSIYAVLDTTPSESTEFVRSMFRLDYLLAAFVLTMPLLWQIVRLSHLPPLMIQWRSLAMAGAICVLIGLGQAGSLRPYIYMNNPLLLVLYTVPEAIQEKATLQKLYATMPLQVDVPAQTSRKSPVTQVLVIGESTTSRHMSLYGYARNTTPHLDRLKPDLEIALDACSSRGTTMAQLKELLTFATRDDHTPLLKIPNLVQVMKSAGFKTFWLSNQQMVGVWDNWSAVFSKPADVRIFTDRRGGFEGASHDEKLLPLLRAALADPAPQRFIVIHLIGTHHAYDLRYPKEFEQFDDRNGVDERVLRIGADNWRITRYNQYDNAVLYNDYIMSEIIELIKNTERATLTYVSDHGEALGEMSDIVGHFDGPMPRQVYEVPLFFFLTNSIKAEIRERLAVFRRNLKIPVQTDWLIHTLLDLYGVDHEAWRAERSLLSPLFSAAHRYCDTRP